MTDRITSECAVGYIRVSTQRQGDSGLGLEAQQHDIADFCKAHHLNLRQEFCEIESGKNNGRPVLAQAIAAAKAADCILLIAKLDRLARNVHFISGLMEQIDFRACDYPTKDRFMLHMQAAFAEEEGRRISNRTREALARAKANGKLLGGANPKCRNLTREGVLKSAQRRAEIACEANAGATQRIAKLRQRGLGFDTIAKQLNADGIRTPRGNHWTPNGCWRLYRRHLITA